MSFKTVGIIARNKRFVEEIDFNVANKEIVNVFYKNKKDLEWMLRFLKGKNKSIISGDILINDEIALNKNWIKKRNAFVKKEVITKFLNAKYWMFFCLFFNYEFYLYVKEDYIKRRYKYLNYVKADHSQTSINLREQINKLISDFVNSSIEIERKWLQDYLDYISDFNNEHIEKQKYSQEVINILKDFYETKETILNLRIEERFHQSVWDKVYNLLDLNSSCMCEYNMSKAKNKDDKRKRKHLRYKEQEQVVREVLSLLDLKIKLIKRKIYKLKNELNNIKMLLNKSFKKDKIKINHSKIFKSFAEWTILSKDQRYEFTKKQDRIIIETLQSEGDSLKGKVIELIHAYHGDVLKDELTFIEEEQFEIEQKELRKDYKAVSTKIWKWLNEQCDLYEIKINNLTIDIKGINSIFMSILRAIFFQKKNIILVNVLHLLSTKEKRYFFKVLKNIIKLNNEVSFIIIDNNIENIYSFDNNIYLVEDQKIFKSNPKGMSYELANLKMFKNINRLKIKKEDNTIYVNNQKIKTNIKYLENGENDIFINPFELTNHANSFYRFIIKITNTTFAIDENLVEGEDEHNNKIVFYSDDIYKKNQKVKLYLTENSFILNEKGSG